MTNRLVLSALICCFTMMAHGVMSREHHEVSSRFFKQESAAFVATSSPLISRSMHRSEKSQTCVTRVSTARTPSTLFMTGDDDSRQATTTTSSQSSTTVAWTREQLEEYASQQGVVLSLTTLGPGFRALVRAKHNTTLILGYVEGFVRPSGEILHMDKMQVFNKIVQQTRQENPTEFKGGGTIFGVGLLVGYLSLLFGQEQGCQIAEFLAIDDEDFQHRRLVRWYKTGGFDVVKYVGEDLKDIPARLVWGGCGTLLRKEIPTLLDYWTTILERPPKKQIS